MEKLIEMHDGGPQVIKLRLSSSRTSGAYYYVWPEEEYRKPRPWGFNRSPYEPLFAVEARKFYRIRVIPQLVSQLTSYVFSDEKPFPFIAPITRQEEVFNFLRNFEDPYVLIDGWCPWAGFEAGLHRISELIVVDRADAIDLYSKREKLFRKISDLFNNTDYYDYYEQGNLQIRVFYLPQNLPEVNSSAPASLFNHAFQFAQPPLWGLTLDNQRMFGFDKEVNTEVLSYDHNTIQFTAPANSIVLFTHPFPSARGVD